MICATLAADGGKGHGCLYGRVWEVRLSEAMAWGHTVPGISRDPRHFQVPGGHDLDLHLA